jgi:PLP dependent protein
VTASPSAAWSRRTADSSSAVRSVSSSIPAPVIARSYGVAHMPDPSTVAEVSRAIGGVHDRIAAAAARAGRAPGGVVLVAVTKFQPLERIEAVVALGVGDLGENRAQDLARRVVDLRDVTSVRWHFIGALQRNKTRIVAELATSFHALERIEIAERLSAQRGSRPPLDVYLEVNVAGEDTKGGVAPAALPQLVDEVRALPGLRVRGLMTMPPPAEFGAENRQHFVALRELADAAGLDELSMGTSSDFEVAVEEGATVVRVGRELFGERRR